jgi:hypothetical protein
MIYSFSYLDSKWRSSHLGRLYLFRYDISGLVCFPGEENQGKYLLTKSLLWNAWQGYKFWFNIYTTQKLIKESRIC